MLERIRKGADEGFTLIETLMVIIILGILAAIVVFAVGTTRSDSVTATCKTDVKSIQLALEAIRTKNGAYPAVQGDSLTGSTAGATNGAVLKAWPGGTDATKDDLVFAYTKGTGSGAYTLKVTGKTLSATGAAQTLNQDSTDDDVAKACAAS